MNKTPPSHFKLFFFPIAVLAICGLASVHSKSFTSDKPERATTVRSARKPGNDPAFAPFTSSLQSPTEDPLGGPISGTDVMALVPLKAEEKLLASTGADCDPRFDLNKYTLEQENGDPFPGPQILALDKTGTWWIEKQFRKDKNGIPHFQRIAAMKSITFTTDFVGNVLKEPVQIVVAAVSAYAGSTDSDKSCHIFSRFLDAQGRPEWVDTNCALESPFPQNLVGCRAVGFFHDPEPPTTDRVFVGFGKGESSNLPAFVVSGGYDPKSLGHIHWNAQKFELSEKDGPTNRIMSFAELNGHFYFTAKPYLYERAYRDGPKGREPYWKIVYKFNGMNGLGALASGLRGLSRVPSPSGQGESLLAVMENRPGVLVRFDQTPAGSSKDIEGIIEANVDEKAKSIPMTYVIGAFNDIETVTDGFGDRHSLIGLEHYTAIPGHEHSAWFLSRSPTLEYSIHEVAPLDDRRSSSDQSLRAIRSIAASPFEKDNGQVLFLAGYDPPFACNPKNRPAPGCKPNWKNCAPRAKNTLWVYRAGINTALH